MYNSTENFNEASYEPEGRNSTTSPEDRRLFVGGLNFITTEQTLKDYFSSFGNVDRAVVTVDLNSGKSRGFAFITYSSLDSIDAVLAVSEHTIDGKQVGVGKAKVRQGKIFVGGLKPQLTDEEIKNYFAAFGKIVEMHSPMDKERNQRKNFCFITFEKESASKSILRTLKHTINGHDVEVKQNVSKPENTMMHGGPMPGGPRGERGGPRGRGTRGGMGSRGRGGYGGYEGSADAGFEHGGYGGGYEAAPSYQHEGYGSGYGAPEFEYGGYGGQAGYGDYNSIYANRGSGVGGRKPRADPY